MIDGDSHVLILPAGWESLQVGWAASNGCMSCVGIDPMCAGQKTVITNPQVGCSAVRRSRTVTTATLLWEHVHHRVIRPCSAQCGGQGLGKTAAGCSLRRDAGRGCTEGGQRDGWPLILG